ncbi:unnamed protein product [Notodromas monacha]|uniref:LIM zinc-binding domain-containing protein n=1 Tax=Notodromas monacha TaxID=399045 RepID=A0A7R9BK00_9CRUS|nr:unnamed protein product [Notodromas monacha]CAG0915788.1 unnamed protein product [Notodromas monacha]
MNGAPQQLPSLPPNPPGQATKSFSEEAGGSTVKVVSPLPWSSNAGSRIAPVVPPKPKKGFYSDSGEGLSHSRDDLTSVYGSHVYETIPSGQKAMPQVPAPQKSAAPIPWSTALKTKNASDGFRSVSFGINLRTNPGAQAIISSSKLPSAGADLNDSDFRDLHKAQPAQIEDLPSSHVVFKPSKAGGNMYSSFLNKPDLHNQSVISYHDYESLDATLDLSGADDLPPPPPPDMEANIPTYTCVGEDASFSSNFPPPPPPEELAVPPPPPPPLMMKPTIAPTIGPKAVPHPMKSGYSNDKTIPAKNTYSSAPVKPYSQRPSIANIAGAGTQQRPSAGYAAPGVTTQGARSINIASSRHVQSNPVEAAKKSAMAFPTGTSSTPTAKVVSVATADTPRKGDEVDKLTELLVQSMTESDADSAGTCQRCRKKVVGEGAGCVAMNQVYHVLCFTCAACGNRLIPLNEENFITKTSLISSTIEKTLEGKPFFVVDAKPHCEECYVETLEKCSVCMKPVLDRILRATGKPYHPKCFCCVACGKCLDGIPFTVDAHNQVHCIADFHKKFAPRCSVCKEPIMPEPGEEETVRVVALDRSFHVKCYRCEDCGMMFSSESDGKGCYPLDGHILCKNCNAKRIQALSSPHQFV